MGRLWPPFFMFTIRVLVRHSVPLTRSLTAPANRPRWPQKPAMSWLAVRLRSQNCAKDFRRPNCRHNGNWRAHSQRRFGEGINPRTCVNLSIFLAFFSTWPHIRCATLFSIDPLFSFRPQSLDLALTTPDHRISADGIDTKGESRWLMAP